MRQFIKNLLNETVLLKESGMRDITNLAVDNSPNRFRLYNR